MEFQEVESLWDLDYWKSSDWETVKGKLNGLDNSDDAYNPNRECLFDNLRVLKPQDIRVVICGQDPYPDRRFATGHAFSIPRVYAKDDFPSSLRIIFREMQSDLAIEYPSHGDLQGWVNQGVLLWNAIPTCLSGISRSHDWREYHSLTTEVLRKISEHGAVFVFLGAVAKSYITPSGLVDNPNCPTICTGHPSPRGNINSAFPFTGSRVFSTINEKLNSIGLEPIDWRLDARDRLAGDQTLEGDVHPRKSNRILPNITGTSCGALYDKRGVLVRE